MLKNIGFLMLALALFLVSWGAFRLFGMWTFIGMLVILVIGSVAGTRPKFGKSKEQDPHP